MSNGRIIWVLMILSVVLCSCNKLNVWRYSLISAIDEVGASRVTVTVSAEVPDDGYHYSVGACVSVNDPIELNLLSGVCQSEDLMIDGIRAKAGRVSWTVTFKDLKPDTEYYVRPYLSGGEDYVTIWGKKSSITTKLSSRPSLLSMELTKVGSRCIDIEVDWDHNGSEITESGIIIAKSEDDLDFSSALKVTGEKTCTAFGLESSTHYYAKAYATNAKGTTISEVVEFITLEPVKVTAVDLGLSVKWADINIGARYPEEYGDYFAWGETSPKSSYSQDNYKFLRIGEKLLYETKYSVYPNSGGPVDGRTTLEQCDDAAFVNWGETWRMPTVQEWYEIMRCCTWTWTTQNGVAGYVIHSEKPGYTGATIFLPAAGEWCSSELEYAGEEGYYWSSSLKTEDFHYRPDDAFAGVFWSESFGKSYLSRADGLSIRPVTDF